MQLFLFAGELVAPAAKGVPTRRLGVSGSTVGLSGPLREDCFSP